MPTSEFPVRLTSICSKPPPQISSKQYPVSHSNRLLTHRNTRRRSAMAIASEDASATAFKTLSAEGGPRSTPPDTTLPADGRRLRVRRGGDRSRAESERPKVRIL